MIPGAMPRASPLSMMDNWIEGGETVMSNTLKPFVDDAASLGNRRADGGERHRQHRHL